jgi:hypothetical protein
LNPAVKQVSHILQQELKYLSGLYHYDLKRFFDPRLLHCANIFAFLEDAAQLGKPFMERLANLAAGIELLSVGTNLHNFNTGDFIKLAESINPVDIGYNADDRDSAGSPEDKIPAEFTSPRTGQKTKKTHFKIEQRYTVDLLFGDIFYSRSVIYLLKYEEHHIFESILDSLKAVHESRLIMHQRLSEVSNSIKSSGSSNVDFEIGLKELLEDNMVPVLGANSLYKTSFLIGWGLFAGTGLQGSFDPGELKFPYEVINDFILSKALNDLAGFFNALPGEYFFLKKIKYISEKKAQIRNRLGAMISGFKQDWLKANFKSLVKLYL